MATPSVGRTWLVQEYKSAVRSLLMSSSRCVHGRDVLPSRLAASDLAVGAVPRAAPHFDCCGLALVATVRQPSTADGQRVVPQRPALPTRRRRRRRVRAAVRVLARARGGGCAPMRTTRTTGCACSAHSDCPRRPHRRGSPRCWQSSTRSTSSRGWWTPRRLVLRCGRRRVGRPSAGVRRGGAAPRSVDAAGRRAVEISRRPSAGREPAAVALRVLDFTRVVAGPVASRTLALLGADVLRVDSPRLPKIPSQHLDSGIGNGRRG